MKLQHRWDIFGKEISLYRNS